jgi:chaperonin GroEL
MSIANEKSRPLLIIADEIEQEPLHMLLTNKMHGAVISCAIKAPSYGDNRIDILHDICLVTGATCFDAAQSIQLEKLKEEHLGSCEKITVSKTLTTLFGLGENVTKEQIDNRIKELKQVLSTPVDGLDDLKRNNIKKRLAKLAGGIAVIHVGGSTEVEIIEKKDRVDDALNATQAAVQEGILPGGGTALFYCAEFLNEKILKNEDNLSEDEIFGARVVYEACKAPLKVIVENTGKNPEVVMDHILRNSDSINYGYNAFTHTYQNLIDNGVIDPVKVTRYAFEFASSVVGLMLTCNCVIMTPEEERSEKEE